MSLLSRLAAAVAGALPQPRTDAQPATPAAAGPVSRLDGLISFLSGIGTNQDKGRAGRWMLSRRRAELIARDQVGKLNGQLTMLRQSAYGVDAYIWRTSLDERVRQMHADRDGDRFEWSSPPEDGHPGMPIQCRCVAEPDIQEQLDELERLGEEELTYGQPDEELLSAAIDELAQWQPDEGLVRRLNNEAIAGLSATAPNSEAPNRELAMQSNVNGRVPRQPRAPKRTESRTAVPRQEGPGRSAGLRSELSTRPRRPLSSEEVQQFQRRCDEEGIRIQWDDQGYLDSRGDPPPAAAMFPEFENEPSVLVLRRDVTRVEAEEEFFHVLDFREQRRIGGEELSTDQKVIARYEIRAKRYLIDNADSLGLSPDEIEDTRDQLARYLEFLRLR